MKQRVIYEDDAAAASEFLFFIDRDSQWWISGSVSLALPSSISFFYSGDNARR